MDNIVKVEIEILLGHILIIIIIIYCSVQNIVSKILKMFVRRVVSQVRFRSGNPKSRQKYSCLNQLPL
jgi:hypothetical protein